MREHYNEEELEAARILDAVKAGLDVPDTAVTWALWICGDTINYREHFDCLM